MIVRLRRLIPFVLVLFLVLRHSSQAATADESKLIALENAWNQAQLHHDAKALDTLVGDRFIYTDTDGSVMDKARFLADIKDPSYRAGRSLSAGGGGDRCLSHQGHRQGQTV
jgi:hypothetical protein